MPGQDLPDGSIAVREGDRLIGFGMADVTPSLDPDGQARCNLSGGVDPAARRRGIGTRLYEQLEQRAVALATERHPGAPAVRSEEHTSELQSRGHLVCRLLLEKKKKTQ